MVGRIISGQGLVLGRPDIRRLAVRDPEAARVVNLVAQVARVPVQLLFGRGRPANVARARQLAMYLLHVSLRRTMHDTGRMLGRDRTTAKHACARIEERREDPRFDAQVCRLEALIGNTQKGSHHVVS
jgi:chromosomal replication initiation ATPase DnaA